MKLEKAIGNNNFFYIMGNSVFIVSLGAAASRLPADICRLTILTVKIDKSPGEVFIKIVAIVPGVF